MKITPKTFLQKTFYFTLFLVSISSYAQTGPGGAGATDGSSNLVLWLRADDGVEEAAANPAVNNDAVFRWLDTSGTGNHGTLGTSPTYLTNQFNGYSSVSFDGTNNILQLTPADLPSGGSARTYIFVSKPNQSGTSQNFFTHGINVKGRRISMVQSTTESSIAVNGHRWGTSFAATTDLRLNAITFPGEGPGITSNNFTLFKNGQSLAPFSDLAGGTVQTINTGTSFATTNTASYDGNFCEIIVYDKQLNTAEFIIVHNTLAAKYNLTLDSNDFYTQDTSGENFDHKVAGIGQASDGTNHSDSQGTGIIRINSPTDLDNDEFLFWGEDVKNANYTFSTSTGYTERINTKWRVSKRNDLGNVTVSIAAADIDLTSKESCAPLKLIVSSSPTFASKTTYNLVLSGGVYTATAVNFSDNDYFTIEYVDNIVIDDTTSYSGAGSGNLPSTSDDCYKLLVKSSANGTITLSEDANVREIEVETGGILAVDSGKKLTATNGIINNGDIRLVGNSQLVQTHTGTSLITGTGNLYVDQTASTVNEFNSGYWSSPVRKSGTAIGTNYTINDVLKDGTVPTAATTTVGEAQDINFIAGYDGDNASSPIKISERWLATLINAQDFTIIGATADDLSPGIGWNMKSVGASFTFKGIPNDGTYTASIDQDNYSVVGNPYPSAINTDQFIAENLSEITGTIYIYNSGTSDDSHIRSEYANGYSTIVINAGVGSGLYLPVGQAFIVTKADAGTGTITFNNSQRIGAISDTQSIVAKTSTSLPILRLDFEFEIDETKTYSRSLAVVFRGLTSGYENGYDGEMLDEKPSDLSLKIEGSENPYVISSIENFSEALEIPLGLVLDKNRTVTFKINALENFPDADIYINDRLEDRFYPISENQPVTLNLSQGNYKDRFFITFNNETLATSVTEKTSNSIKIITNEDKKILVKNTSNLFLNTIKIYDLLGKQIFKNELQSNISEYKIDMENKSPAIYIVVINSENGLIRKKIILK